MKQKSSVYKEKHWFWY